MDTSTRGKLRFRAGRGALIWLAPLLALWLVTSAAAAAAPAGEPAAEARVTLANRTIAVLRTSFMGVGAERRAERAHKALEDIADTPGPGQVTVRVEPQGHALLVDGELAFILAPGDADVAAGQTLEQASRAARNALEKALREASEWRDPGRIAKALGISIAATLVVVALLGLVRRLRRVAVDRIAAVLATHTLRVGPQRLPMTYLLGAAGAAVRVVALAAALILAYEWVTIVLHQFPYTRPWAEGLRSHLVGVALRLGMGALEAMPDLVVAVAILLLARGVTVVARPFFNRVVASGGAWGGWFDADTARPTQRLFNGAVVVFGIVMAYPYLPGSGSDAFKGISVLLGVMVTIGGSSIVAHVGSGLVLLYSHTLRVGEYVRVGDCEGRITKTGTFTTHILTDAGEDIVLSNTYILGTVTTNYSRAAAAGGCLVDTTLTIGYDTPWRQVQAMMIEAARRTADVLPDPPPRVFQTALADFYPQYRIVCHALPRPPRKRLDVLSDLHAQLQDVFNEYGVQIMSPHYLGDPESAKIVPPAKWHPAPARPADGGAPTLGPRPG